MKSLRLLAFIAVTALTLGVGAATPDNELIASICKAQTLEHGGGLNACGCHFNRREGTCHCHRGGSCGCACQPATCK